MRQTSHRSRTHTSRQEMANEQYLHIIILNVFWSTFHSVEIVSRVYLLHSNIQTNDNNARHTISSSYLRFSFSSILCASVASSRKSSQWRFLFWSVGCLLSDSTSHRNTKLYCSACPLCVTLYFSSSSSFSARFQRM